MDLNDDTTVKQFLIIVNLAMSGVIWALWSQLKSKDKSVTELTKYYVSSMLKLVDKITGNEK